MLPTSTVHRPLKGNNQGLSKANQENPDRANSAYHMSWPTEELNNLFLRVDSTNYDDKEDSADFAHTANACLHYINTPSNLLLDFKGKTTYSHGPFDSEMHQKRNQLLDMALHFLLMKNKKAAEIIWTAVRVSYQNRGLGLEISEADIFSSRFINSRMKREALLAAAEMGRQVAQYCCWHMREELKIEESIARENLGKSVAQEYPLALEAYLPAIQEEFFPQASQQLANFTKPKTLFGSVMGFFQPGASPANVSSESETTVTPQPTKTQVANEKFEAGQLELKARHPIQALKNFKNAAFDGHVEAAVEAGKILANAKNYSEAVQFYKLAIANGHTEKAFFEALIHELEYRQSQVKLGSFSLNLSFSSSLTNAINGYSAYIRSNGAFAELAIMKCVELKMEAKIPVSGEEFYVLGKLYFEGNKKIGITNDEDKAEQYFKLAANLGHAQAAYTLCKRYDESDSSEESLGWTPSNPEEGYLHYLEIAANAGHPEAMEKFKPIQEERKQKLEAQEKAENAKRQALIAEQRNKLIAEQRKLDENQAYFENPHAEKPKPKSGFLSFFK